MVIPLHPNVLLRPGRRKQEGLDLPDEMKEKNGEGEVLGAYAECTRVKKGDRVIFSKYKPTQITLDGEVLYLADEKDILAIIN